MKTSYYKLFSESPIIINRLQTLLEEQGIDPLIKNQIESARLAGFGVSTQTIDLFIHGADIEKANLILNDFKNQMTL